MKSQGFLFTMKVKKGGTAMKKKIVGLCACPAGIAHTYIVADKLEGEAKRMGYEAKVETQGFVGIENELTREDLNEASLIILANDIAISGEERFEGYEAKTVHSSMHEILHHAHEVIERFFEKEG